MSTSPCVYAFQHSIVPDSDSLYHRLFSHPQMVAGLVHEFAPRDLAADLDFSGLQRVNAKFHPSRGSARRREADVIWRLPIRTGADPYLYLLIEFQSRRDQWMAVRSQVYQGLLWQQVIDERRLQASARLPPLLLLVLYNGKRRWDAKTQTSDLILLPPDSSLWSWQPHSRYCLLDIGSFSSDELARSPSLVSLLFRFEQRNPPKALKQLVKEVVSWFKQNRGCERLQRLFAELIREAFAQNGVNLPKTFNLLEMKMKSMLGTRMKDWEMQWFTQGKAKGEAKGKAEGRAEGKAEALISLLAGKFGTVAPSWRKRIQNAKLVTLNRWFKRAIVAPDLRSVFSSKR